MEDGRIIEGSFCCLDKQGNLVLTGASQISKQDTQRFLGNVVVPAKQMKSCTLSPSTPVAVQQGRLEI